MPRRRARGYQPAPLTSRPPFEVGNTAAARSGAWSERLVSETAEELRPRLQTVVAQALWVRPMDVDALEDYLWDRARLQRLEEWLAANGDEDATTGREYFENPAIVWLEPDSAHRAG